MLLGFELFLVNKEDTIDFALAVSADCSVFAIAFFMEALAAS